MTQRTAHGNDLAFVMKGMRQHMMKNERRGADGNVPIRKMKLRIGIELLIGQGRQISVGRLADFLLRSLTSATTEHSSTVRLAYRNPWSV